MKKHYLAIALLGAISNTAQAQTFMDNLRGLKQSVRTLAGKGPKSADELKNAANDSQGSPGTVDDIIPSAALIDDTSDSALAGTALVKGNVLTFDVLGFKLGMSPREVKRVSKQKGVVRNGPPTISGSFELEATAKANYNLSKTIARTSKVYWRGGMGRIGTTAHASFLTDLEPGGPKLNFIQYSSKLEGQTREQLAAAVVAKYGPATRHVQGTGRWLWCQSAAKCDSAYNLYPYMTLDVGEETAEFDLSTGGKLQEASTMRLDARAEAIRAATGKKVQF